MEFPEKQTNHTQPVYISWEEGYDSEWEFSVTVYDNFIHWNLEFDIQYSGTPKNACQGFEDFLKNGPVSDFAQDVDDFRLEEITNAVKDKMNHPLYQPYSTSEKKTGAKNPETQPLIQQPVTKEPVPEDMKTSWENQKNGKIDYVYLCYNEIVIGSKDEMGINDNAASASHQDFLSGNLQDLVKNSFGHETLKEIIAYVKKASHYEPFCKQREQIQARIDWMTTIPVDASLEKIIDSPQIISGSQYYGNAGGYNTKLETPDYIFYLNCDDLDHIQCLVTVQETKEEFRFPFSGCCNSVVEHKGFFYISYLDHFAAVSYKGDFIFDTARIFDSNQNLVFGSSLRVSRTLKHEGIILVECRRIFEESGSHFLKFDPARRTFIARYYKD